MSVQLDLTEEQAKWLLETLQAQLHDLSWEQREYRLRDHERRLHLEAVIPRLQQEIKKGKWE